MPDDRKIYLKEGNYREINNSGLYVEGNYYNGTLSRELIDSVTIEIENLLTYCQSNDNPPLQEAMTIVGDSKTRQPELNNSDTIRAVIDNSPTLKQRLISASKTFALKTATTLLPPLDVALSTIDSFKNPNSN